MLSNKEVEALKSGAYGMTRSGRKALFAEKAHDGSYTWLLFSKTNPNKPDYFMEDYNTFSTYYNDAHPEDDNDIIGLWEDKLIPFNVKYALEGKPILLRNGLKGYILKQIDDTLIGYFDHSSPCSWELDGSHSRAADTQFDIIGMWKEPEPVKPNADDLPKPIREF
ncbi:hypothetical protein BKK54_11415, partial [Rodentibacter genomosp. 1]